MVEGPTQDVVVGARDVICSAVREEIDMVDSRILVDLSVVAGFRDRLRTQSPTTSLVAATAQLAGIHGVSFDLRGPLKKSIELDAKHVQNALSPWVQPRFVANFRPARFGI